MTTRGTTLSALRGRKRSFTSRALISFLIYSLATPAHAVTMGQLKGYKGFQAAALAVAVVNKAMKEASENPMDAWRRQNVAHAVGLMPLAIRALAEEFQSGKLHDGDLKFVTGILGGFVDMSAPDSFQKFLKNPADKSLIPQLGANFPKEILRQADEQGLPVQSKSITFDETAKRGNGSLAQVSDSSVPSASDKQIVDLSQSLKGINSKSGLSGDQRASVGSKSITFNEDAPKNPSGYGVSSGFKKPGETQGFDIQLERDIASVESQLGLKSKSALRIAKAAEQVEKTELSDAFFTEKKKPKQALSKRDPANYKTKIRPKFWRVVPLLMLFVKDSHADAPAPAANPGGGESKSPCQSGQCGGGGGGQGGGGGGEGGGKGGADFLFGLAAIMAAAAPMVAAAIQANADKKIAKDNNQTQKELAQIAADNAKYASDSQSRIAQQQNQLADGISKRNSDTQLATLALNLNEVKAGREQAYDSEVARREEERKLNEERIALAQRQADDNLKLARASFNAQLTQAGLTTGVSDGTTGGSNGLSLDDKVNARTTTAAQTALAANTANALGTGFGQTGLTGPDLKGQASGTGGMESTGQAFMRQPASTKLVAAATTSKKDTRAFFDGASEEDDDDSIEGSKNLKSKKKVSAKRLSLRGVRSLYRGAYTANSKNVLANSSAYTTVATGSSRGFLNKIEEKKSDLTDFTKQIERKANNESFATWNRGSRTVGDEVQAAVSGTSPRSSVYNAPKDEAHGSSRGIY